MSCGSMLLACLALLRLVEFLLVQEEVGRLESRETLPSLRGWPGRGVQWWVR